jgi:hypothetical protein
MWLGFGKERWPEFFLEIDGDAVRKEPLNPKSTF